MEHPLTAKVVLTKGPSLLLDYIVPTRLEELLLVGDLLLLPLGTKEREGIVIALERKPSTRTLKEVKERVSETPLLTKELLELAHWMSFYYLTPLAKTIRMMLPKSVQKETKERERILVRRLWTKIKLREYAATRRNQAPKECNVIDILLQERAPLFLSELLKRASCSNSTIDRLVEKGMVERRSLFLDLLLSEAEILPTAPKQLNEEQTVALAKIQAAFDHGSFSPFLLHGVTGSGKTEVYLQAIQYLIDRGKSALVLIPELSLAPQTLQRLEARFGKRVALIHSGIKESQRKLYFRKMMEGEIKVCVGARSALFVPLQKLALIVVDEEHESAYKEGERMPAYHAREVAAVRAAQASATLLLASATPSLESYRNAMSQKYTLLELKGRAQGALPLFHIVDMRRERSKIFSQLLLDKIREKTAKQEQVLILLNRRGFQTLSLCPTCNEMISCPNCEGALVYHRKANQLVCHLCDHRRSLPKQCPKCSSPQGIQLKGFGTEMIESTLQAIFPALRLLRIDTDTATSKGTLEGLLHNFRSGKSDLLIGTKMIAKGLHFPQVTLVGIISPDSALAIPDFRSAETTFQLISQVAGRAGRDELKGEVVLQSFTPHQPLFRWAKEGNYLAFYEDEVKSRELFFYPPFSKMIRFIFSSPDQKVAQSAIEHVYRELSALVPTVEWTEPMASGHAKVRGSFRYHFFGRCSRLDKLQSVVPPLLSKMTFPASLKWFIDVNPQDTFF